MSKDGPRLVGASAVFQTFVHESPSASGKMDVGTQGRPARVVAPHRRVTVDLSPRRGDISIAERKGRVTRPG